jgi:hypothetical protein
MDPAKCEYTGHPCELWGVGDRACMAMTPEQCPYNTADDAEAIREWQWRNPKET